MSYTTNNIQINNLSSITKNAPSHVINSIQLASDKSGVDFSYLVQQASAESSFNPNAEAKTSSATGLFQFIDSTWLSMVDRYGDDYGIETDGKTKAEILDMRKDPKSASLMAAAFASQNEKSLNNNWGGEVGATELYFTHFMGANGGASFLNARDENPLRPAADLFPKAAKANRNVFYDPKDGEARTLEQVYQFFDKKFQLKGDGKDIKTNENIPIAKASNNKVYTPVNNRISDSIVMQKSQEMRDLAARRMYGQAPNMNKVNNSLFTQKSTDNSASQTMPFFSLLAKPLDLMLMTQSVPSKVVRDIS